MRNYYSNIVIQEVDCGCVVHKVERLGRLPLYYIEGMDEGLTPNPLLAGAIDYFYVDKFMIRELLRQYCPHNLKIL